MVYLVTIFKNDPYEMYNLVNSTDASHKRVLSRLNALLMVTKSCEQDSCRDPWLALQPPGQTRIPISNLEQALDPKHDEWFGGFPKVHFNSCMEYQDADNEAPFWPPQAREGLGLKYRGPTDNYPSREDAMLYVNGTEGAGTVAQRNTTLAELMSIAKVLTVEQLGSDSSNG